MTSNTEITAATTQPAIVAQPYLWTDPAKIPPRPWVYGTHLLRGSMSMLVGEGAVGKSSIVTGMALSLVTGKSLLGSKVHGSTPKRVWIINLEDSQHEIARSIQAAASHWNIKPDDMGDRLFVNAGVGSSFHMIKNSVHGVVPNDELVKAMVADIVANQIDVVTIDPLISTHGMSENDNIAMDKLAKTFALIAEHAQCSVLLIHHAGKGRSEAGADAARGASSLVAAARSVVRAVRMTPSEANDFGIEDESFRSYVRLYDDKNNRAAAAKAWSWMQIVSVPLGNGDVEGGDTVGVMVPANLAEPEAIPDLTGEIIHQIQTDVYLDGGFKYHPTAKNWIGHLIAEKLGVEKYKSSKSGPIQNMVDQLIEDGFFKLVERKESNGRMCSYVIPDNYTYMSEAKSFLN